MDYDINHDHWRRRALELQQRLHTEIPLAHSMQIEVSGYSGRALTLRAPLAANINHKHTAFGGSLYSLAVLAGWGLISLLLADSRQAGEIVIQNASIQYQRAIAEDFEATCVLPGDDLVAQFLDTLSRRDRARLLLEVTIGAPEQPAVLFSGNYVVHAPKNG